MSQLMRLLHVRFVLGARRYDRITPVLQVLHWLPVRRRVYFKMATLVYLSLTGWLCGRRLSVGLRRQ